MRAFVARALGKVGKLDGEQIKTLVQNLAHDSERLEMVLDSLPDGLIVSDEAHAITFVNKAARRLLPLDSTKLNTDSTVWFAIADQDVAAMVQDSLERDETILDHEFALDHGSATRILSFSIVPLVEAGTIRGTIVHVVDVSERRNREARLRRAESLASLTTLAAGVAHEIKNPLGSIGIHTQLIKKAVSQDDSSQREDILEYLEVVDEEIQRLNHIVVDFLFAVRPMDIQLSDGCVADVVQQLLDFVQYELNEHNVLLVRDLDEPLPRVLLDERYFKQAVMNIVKNAISAMPNGGELTVATSVREENVVLSITDTGEGMSDEVLRKIFEPYFTTRDFGSGIGLTLVYKIVKEHMGDIRVHSRVGEGTTFEIFVPIPQQETRLLNWHSE